MCSNPSTKTRKLTIRPDFDTDVYLHPPSMLRHYQQHRTRNISTSSVGSNDDDKNGSSPTHRRFSFSNIFAYFRQNSSSEFPTLNNTNATNEPSKIENNSTKDGIVKEEDFQKINPNRALHFDDEF